MAKGLVLLNLGTPERPDVSSVRRYLSEFLSDPRVVDIPALIRYALLYGIILPFRSKRTSKAYQAIWTKDGSPLLVNGKKLQYKLQQHLGNDWHVTLGMRYGKPSIEQALKEVQHCQQLLILPLFPQYASSTSGSAIEKTLKLIQGNRVLPSINIIRDFYQLPAFINAQAGLIKTRLAEHDHLLFSFHGLPLRHIEKEGCTPVCQTPCPPPLESRPSCYRAQCYETARKLAAILNLTDNDWSVGFQSRLGSTPWIQPYIEKNLLHLSEKGVKNLLVCCPSFTADCLETLEEIEIRAQKLWQQYQGDTLTLVPCVNDETQWVEALGRFLSKQMPNLELA